MCSSFIAIMVSMNDKYGTKSRFLCVYAFAFSMFVFDIIFIFQIGYICMETLLTVFFPLSAIVVVVLFL